jgi:uncharacterized protein (DUF58 family)
VAAGAAVVLLIAGRLLGVTELFGVFAAIVALLVASAIRVRVPRVRAVLSHRMAPEQMVAGQPAVLELFVENTALQPTPANRLQLLPREGARHRILVPRLAPGERATVTIGLDTARRGLHTVDGYEVVVADGLGLARQRVTSSGALKYTVCPRIEELPQTLPLTAGSSGVESTRSAAQRLRSGLSALRGYIEGDDLRRIHWPTTARVGELMVREGGDPDFSTRSGTTILLGTRRGGGDAFERAVEVAASLAAAACREGPFRLVTTGGYDSRMADGPAHLGEVTLQLGTIQPTRRSELTGRAPEAAEILTQLAARIAGPEDWNVLLAVEAAAGKDDLELSSQLLAELPPRMGAIILVLVGGREPSFERLGRNELIVYLPPFMPMTEVWSAALDLPIGEVRALETAGAPWAPPGPVTEAV